MTLNYDALKRLLNDAFDGNYNAFARAMNIDVAQLYRILNGNGSVGLKTLNKIVDFCKENDLDIHEYIFFP